MIREDEDALTCDMAQVYGVWDWRALPLSTATALAWGLPDDARVKRRAAGADAVSDNLLLALLTDEIRALRWMLSKDGEPPESIVLKLTGQGSEKERKTASFDTPEEFMAARRRALGKETE